MIDFMTIFNKKNLYEILQEMNTVAIPFYRDMVENGVDDLENTKYFLLVLDKLYQAGMISPLRDEEYDEALELYLNAGGDMIRGDMSSGDKAIHIYPSLKGTIKPKVHYVTEKERLKDKNRVKNHRSIEQWLHLLFYNNRLPDEEIELGFFMKYDGLSLVLTVRDGKVVSAITRGDKDLGLGEDKTKIFKDFDVESLIPEFGKDFGLKVEAVVLKDWFDGYNEKFGNNKLVDERSAATSILNSDDPTTEQLSYLYLIPLAVKIGKDDVDHDFTGDLVEFLPSKKHELVGWYDHAGTVVKRYKMSSRLTDDWERDMRNIKKIIDGMYSQIKEEPSPADGIVVRILNERSQRLLGRDWDACTNNFEIAYKFPPESQKTKLISIEQEIGLMGKVSFVAKVKPVKLKRKTIKSISLGSEARFLDLNLAPKDEVMVRYDIIPYLDVTDDCKKSDNEPVLVITHCPYCGQELIRNPELMCGNTECPSRVVGQIYNYCRKMGMNGIGEESITDLFHHGLVSSIGDLYTLKKHVDEIAQLDGWGAKSAKLLVDAIQEVNEVPAHILLGSLGIPNISHQTFKKLLTKYKLKDVFELTEKDIPDMCEIEGIQTKTAKKIVEGIQQNEKNLTVIMSHVKVKKDKQKTYELSVVFTGVRNHEFEKYLDELNVQTTDGVSKHTTFVISKAGYESGKTRKAQKLGIPIITIEDAYKKFKYAE